MRKILRNLFGSLLMASVVFQAGNAQSPDSKVCNCFTGPVSADFMLGCKAFYGTVGVTLNRNDIVKPNENVPVKFLIPRLPVKQGCGGVYSIYITDASGNKIFDREDSHNEFYYTFTECNKTYSVQLIATANSTAGIEGNCTRRINFTVKPLCNTASCNCDPVSSKPLGTSINFNLTGKVTCLAPTERQRRYTLQYAFVNKTGCNLIIESITVLGETIGSSSITIPAMGRSPSFNSGFTTPLTQPVPAGSSVNISVRYKLNNKPCSVIIKLPYTACN